MFWVFFVLFFGCKICGILAPTQTCTFCFGRPALNHWTAREVPAVLFLLVFFFFFVYKFPKCFLWWVHLPLQLCTLLSAPGGWPVWTKVMGFPALWLGLANAYPCQEIREQEEKIRVHFPISFLAVASGWLCRRYIFQVWCWLSQTLLSGSRNTLVPKQKELLFPGPYCSLQPSQPHTICNL